MIAIDWGSSSLRAWRLDANGAILDTRRVELGALGHGAAFVVPALCYAALCAFAIAAGRTPPRNAASAKSLH